MLPSARERRAAPRIPLRSKLTMQIDNKRLSCKLLEISTRGALVQCPVPLEPKQVARVLFKIPPSKAQFDVKGLVTRHIGAGGIHHLALEFLVPPAWQTTALGHLVSRTRERCTGSAQTRAGDPPHLRQLYAEAIRELDEAEAGR